MTSHLSARCLSGAFLIGILALFGAGCPLDRVRDAFGDMKAVSEQALSPEQVSSRIRFAPGDRLVIHQAFYGLEDLASYLAPSSAPTERVVTVRSFTPRKGADLEWTITAERETKESQDARAAYQASLDDRRVGDSYPIPPDVATEITTTTGTVEHINLSNSHRLFPPSYWVAGDVNAVDGKSAIWLDDDSFLELSKTGQASVAFDLFGEDADRVFHLSQKVFEMISRLEKRAIEENRKTDLSILHAERITWPIRIGDATYQAAAWKATNAFGELVILDNRDNPLVLQMRVRLAFAGAADIVNAQANWTDLMGYDVSSIEVGSFDVDDQE